VSFGFSSVVLYAALKAGITESTKEENRSLGFSIFNASMSFSTILLGIIFELVFFLNGVNVTSYKIIFGVLISIFFLNVFIIARYSELKRKLLTSQKIRIMEILKEERYWKTLVVIFFSALPMTGVFSPGIVLPIYMDRELGSTFGYGFFFAVFSLLTGVFSVVFDPLTNYLSLYNCIVLGGIITSTGPLFFLAANNYITIACYILVTAIGAAILESRIFDYNGFVSVKGQEGFYYGLASFGYAVTAVSTGFFSGFMLKEFCPEDGERQCWKMWLGLSFVCIGGTFLLVLLKPFIEVPEKRLNDEMW
jgi:MFS family permease